MPTEPVSPIEERHIDFILEEEFCVNPDFLAFFLEEAAAGGCQMPTPHVKHACTAVRSVVARTDDKDGETDILVKYFSAERLPVAIMIEDKIRAGFQPEQAQRYRIRGEQGLGKGWSSYFTCLIAHKKYSAKQSDFDIRVSLQSLHGFFASRSDERSRFRAAVLQSTIAKFEKSGVQRIDEKMTRYRAIYAATFESTMPLSYWIHQPARDAYSGDYWFEFHVRGWPKGVLIRHRAERGRVQLIFPMRDDALFRKILQEHAPSLQDCPHPSIEVVPVGEASSAFELCVPVASFSDAPRHTEEFFAAIECLDRFYQAASHMLPVPFQLSLRPQPSSPADKARNALSAMLLGFMRSRVTAEEAGMPYPLPDLAKIEATSNETHYFPSAGSMGGFYVRMKYDEEGSRYLLVEIASRQWGSYTETYRITLDEITRVPSE